MMTQLTDEQKLIVQSAKEFAEREVAPLADRMDREDYYPVELFKKAADLGFAGLPLPEEYGGIDADMTTELLVIKEIGKVSPAFGLIIDVHWFAETQILAYGTDEQKAKYLPQMANGSKIGGVSNTDPSGTANFGEWSIGAVLEDDHYVINTPKVLQTSSSQSGIIVLTALTDAGTKKFIIDREEMDGVKVIDHEDKLGLRGSGTGSIQYENVIVPVENVLIGAGSKYEYAPFLDVSSICLGIAEGCVEAARNYLQKRSHAGKPIIGLNQIPIDLARMIGEVEVIRSVVSTMAEEFEADVPVNVHSFIAKAWIPEHTCQIAHKCIELCGAVGYITDMPFGRYLRDAEGFRIAEGSENLQWALVALYSGIACSL
ncbi:MAG: acyl-CoA dehydrogenase family protein [Coriobacteriia bacterium]|nr:acyl-CoA dehydrogenase family protein [Coriobacteriia bacterium]